MIILIELCDMTYKELFDSVSFEEIVPYIKKYYDYLSDSYVVFFLRDNYPAIVYCYPLKCTKKMNSCIIPTKSAPLFGLTRLIDWVDSFYRLS